MTATSTALPASARGSFSRPLVRHGRQLVLTLSGLLVLAGLWQLGIWQLQQSLPLARMLAPAPALETLVELVGSGEILGDVLASLRRVLLSLCLALAVGIPVGLAVGFWQRFDAATSGAFQFLRMISPLSWMPIAVMIFGIGDSPVYFLLCMGAVWPVILNTAAGVRNLDPRWLILAQSMSASRSELLLRVVLPGILGSVLTGTRLAIGMIWVLLVPCEMLGVTSGLGYFILDTRDRLAYSELMAAILLIGMLGYLLDSLARQVQRRWA